ncbi:COX assembly mitochondrial protein [bacterium]|nr:COX assembly mitochondrial protein [bacterium]
MVVFKCRDENRALNKCLEQYTNQEKREEWLRAKGIEVKKK